MYKEFIVILDNKKSKHFKGDYTMSTPKTTTTTLPVETNTTTANDVNNREKEQGALPNQTVVTKETGFFASITKEQVLKVAQYTIIAIAVIAAVAAIVTFFVPVAVSYASTFSKTSFNSAP